ncbi:MAG: ABC transporter ATP-binding protein, partial [Clostridiales bacterium]|nr:ABC transporter ATP-binding protein [Clostridiales bacterium]
MLKLIRYLKGSGKYIILIVLLLGLQAYSDLSLPQYTSDIVNVGIQQGGISDRIPKVIRESEMNKLLSFLDESEAVEVLEYYDLDSGQYSIKEETFLENQELIRLLKKPILALSLLESKATSIEQQTEELPGTITDQMMMSYVKNEYEALGLDMNSIQTKYIIATGIKMLGYALIGMLASIVVVFLASRISATLGRDLRGAVFKKVLSFSNAEFDQFSTASLITRSTNDIQQIQGMLVMLIRILFYAPILGIGGVLKVFNTNTSMAWIIGVAVAVIMVIIGFLFAVVMPKFKVLQDLVDKVNLVTREILTGLSVVRAFNREKHEEERFDKANRDL